MKKPTASKLIYELLSMSAELLFDKHWGMKHRVGFILDEEQKYNEDAVLFRVDEVFGDSPSGKVTSCLWILLKPVKGQRAPKLLVGNLMEELMLESFETPQRDKAPVKIFMNNQDLELRELQHEFSISAIESGDGTNDIDICIYLKEKGKRRK